jgi:pyruvate, water dikinase
VDDRLYWLGQAGPDGSPEGPLTDPGHPLHQLNALMQQGYPVLPGCVIPARTFQAWLAQATRDLPGWPYRSSGPHHFPTDDPHHLQAVAQRLRRQLLQTPIPESAALPAALERLSTGKFVAESNPKSNPESNPESSPASSPESSPESSLWLRPLVQTASSSQSLEVDDLLAADLAAAQRCPARLEAFCASLQQIWAAPFRARNLLYWQQIGQPLEAIALSVLVQPLPVAQSAGQLWLAVDGWVVQAARGLNGAEMMPDTYWLTPQTGVMTGQRWGDQPMADHPAEHPAQPVLSADRLTQLVSLGQRLTADRALPLQVDWCFTAGGQLWITQCALGVGSHPPPIGPIGTQLASAAANVQAARSVGPDPTAASEPSSAALVRGVQASSGDLVGRALVLTNSVAVATLPPGTVLVTHHLTPDWLPLIRQAAGVITEQGGLTSHAAILARELGIPAIVGAPQATQRIRTGDWLHIQQGQVSRLSALAAARLQARSAAAHDPLLIPTHSAAKRVTQLMVNLSQPEELSEIAALPVDGVGMLRSELMILPLLRAQSPQRWLEQNRQAEFTDQLAGRIRQFALAFAPRPVFYRTLDWRAHEFASLTQAPPARGPEGWSPPPEPNPTLGLHGTLSYQQDATWFDLELAALAQLQAEGHRNLGILLPFVRRVEEFTFCRERIHQAGLASLPLWIMAEVPSVLFLLPAYVEAGVQGIAIGPNDLAQLLFGLDRDHPLSSQLFDLHHPVLLGAIGQLVQTAQQLNIPCAICHAEPSWIEQLVAWGVTAVYVGPKEALTTHEALVRAEQLPDRPQP